jgi:multidrug efflux system membrane fusion protein
LVRAHEQVVVEAWNRDHSVLLETGTLEAIDNVVDPTTGTVRCKAEFANADQTLFPSQFVTVRVHLPEQPHVVLVPQTGVQQGPKGPFAYRVTADQTVEVVPVTLGATEMAAGHAATDMVVVENGLSPGDTVVTDGVDMVHPGSAVHVVVDGEAKATSTDTKRHARKDRS